MYKPLPVITEALDALEARMKRERDGPRRLRLHLLVLIRSGAVQERREAAAYLRVHRNTIGRWLQSYEVGGLEQLLEIQKVGAKPVQKSLPPRVWSALQERLAAEGFEGYLEVQRWLEAEYALPVPYATVHKLVRYRLGAKLKRARPRHAKKTKPRRAPSPNTSSTWSMRP